VFFGYFAYEMPLWLCIVVALVPPMVAAVAMRLLVNPKSENDADKALEDRHGRVIAILSTAFVFTVTFSTTNVWNQDEKVYESANQLTQTTLSITQTVSYALPNEADTAEAQLEAMMTAFPFDVTELSIRASPQTIHQMREFHSWVNSLPLPKSDRDIVDGLLGELDQQWRTWLTALNGAGIPDVMWLLIAILGLMLVAAVAMLPRGSDGKHETTLLFWFALIIGVMQIPLWVLNSMGFAEVLVESVFGEFVNVRPPVDRFAMGLIVTAALAAVFFLVLKLLPHVRKEAKTEDAQTPAD